MNAKSVLISASVVRTSLFLALGSILPLHANPAESNPLLATRTAANRLQLVVAAPAALNLLRSDNVTGVLTSLIANVFRQSGFRGQLTAVPVGESAQSDAPTLEVYLLEWRITGAGNVDCTFGATLTTASGSERLGVFDGTSRQMFGLRDAFNRAEAFDEAANDAIDNLYGELREKTYVQRSSFDFPRP